MALAHAWKVVLAPREKLVLLALADHANDEDFTCFPSYQHLSEKTNLSRSSVIRSIKSLEAKGVIKRMQRRSGTVIQLSNLYELTYAKQIAALTK